MRQIIPRYDQNVINYMENLKTGFLPKFKRNAFEQLSWYFKTLKLKPPNFAIFRCGYAYIFFKIPLCLKN